MLERLLGVQVSEPTVRRQAEAAGAQVEAVQTAKAYTSEPEESWEQGAARQVISADGAYVPLPSGRMGRGAHGGNWRSARGKLDY
jgi:hypothetical protein